MDLPVLPAVDALRRAVVAGTRPLPPSAGLDAYAAKVRERPYTVTDADVEALLAAGRSDDELFELTVAVAVEAGLARLQRALAAIEAASA